MAVVLRGFADGTNVRPVRAHGRVAPHVSVLRGPVRFAESVDPLFMLGIRSAGTVTEDRARGRPDGLFSR